jgi:lysozyme
MTKTLIDLVKHYEGCSLTAYPDPGTGMEPITIGYGTTGTFRLGDTCTTAEAEEWLLADLEELQANVQNALHVAINQNQLDALTAFAYNVGIGNLKGSTLLRRINEGRPDPTQFLRWTWAAGKEMPGLIKRRHAEMNLFMTPVMNERSATV